MNQLPRILEVQNLTGAVKAFDFSDEFLSKKLTFLLPEVQVEGDKADIDVIQTTSEAPEFVSPGGSAINRPLTSRGTISVRMPYIKESFFINADLMQRLREAGKTTAQSAVARLAQELEESTRRVHRGMELLRFRALSTSYRVVLDGNLVELDSPYSPSHLPDVSSSAPWSNPSADIRSQITEWKRLVSRDSGRQISHALLNPMTMNYVLKNDYIMTVLGGSTAGEQLVTGAEEFRFFGLQWVSWDAFYTDPWDGEEKPFIEDNYVILVPSAGDWGEMQVGQVSYVNDANEIAQDWGPVSYTELSRNPVGVTAYVAWCGLAVVKVPNAVVIAKVA